MKLKKPKLREIPRPPVKTDEEGKVIGLTPRQLDSFMKKVDRINKKNCELLKEYNSAVAKAKTVRKKLEEARKTCKTRLEPKPKK